VNGFILPHFEKFFHWKTGLDFISKKEREKLQMKHKVKKSVKFAKVQRNDVVLLP
jgi:hypothetical protein